MNYITGVDFIENEVNILEKRTNNLEKLKEETYMTFTFTFHFQKN